MGVGTGACVLLCLITVATATPTVGVLAGLLGSPDTCPKPATSVSDGPLCIVKKLLGAVSGVGGTAVQIIEDLTGISTCNGYGDIGNLIIKIGHAVGNIIDTVLPRLGTFLARVIDAAVRIVICVGLTPARILLGACPPEVCTSSYGSKYGWQSYDKFGSCSDVVQQCNCEINEWIHRLSTEHKYLSLKGVLAEIVCEVLTIAKLTINFTVKVTKNDLLVLLSKVTTILSVIGECIEPKLGTQLIDGVFGLLGGVFGTNCQPCEDEKSAAKDKIKDIKSSDHGIFNGKKSDSSERGSSEENKSKEKSDSEEYKSKEKSDSEENKSKEKSNSEENKGNGKSESEDNKSQENSNSKEIKIKEKSDSEEYKSKEKSNSGEYKSKESCDSEENKRKEKSCDK